MQKFQGTLQNSMMRKRNHGAFTVGFCSPNLKAYSYISASLTALLALVAKRRRWIKATNLEKTWQEAVVGLKPNGSRIISRRRGIGRRIMTISDVGLALADELYLGYVRYAHQRWWSHVSAGCRLRTRLWREYYQHDVDVIAPVRHSDVTHNDLQDLQQQVISQVLYSVW